MNGNVMYHEARMEVVDAPLASITNGSVHIFFGYEDPKLITFTHLGAMLIQEVCRNSHTACVVG